MLGPCLVMMRAGLSAAGEADVAGRGGVRHPRWPDSDCQLGSCPDSPAGEWHGGPHQASRIFLRIFKLSNSSRIEIIHKNIIEQSKL